MIAGSDGASFRLIVLIDYFCEGFEAEAFLINAKRSTAASGATR
jgi:hypothetical protein